MTNIVDFSTNNPLNIDEDVTAVLEEFGLPPILFNLANKFGNRIDGFDATYGSLITDVAQIGRNFTWRKKFEEVLNKSGISFKFNNDATNKEVSLSPRIILSDEQMPFDRSQTEIYNRFSEQSRMVVRFILLWITYDDGQISMNEILKRGFDLQPWGVPPLRHVDALIGVIAGPISEHHLPQFAWTRPLTPLPPVTCPSPTPPTLLTTMPPPNTKRPEKTPPRPKNEDEPLDEGYQMPNSGICQFDIYFQKGKRGVRGKILSDDEIYHNYTKRVQDVHHTVAGKDHSDKDFRQEMSKRLGPLHFQKWEELYPMH